MIVKYFYGDRTPIIVQSYHSTAGSKHVGTKQVPVVTICGIYDEETGKLSIGISRCSEKDVFVKKIGRDLARNRATTDPYIVVNLEKGSRFSEMFYDMAKILTRKFTNGTYRL